VEVTSVSEIDVEVVVEGDRHREIRIFVNDVELKTNREVLTGREILELAGVPITNHLFLEVEGHAEDDPIGPDVPVKLHEGMRFFDVPVGTFG
jgi:hypothetical protein